MQPDALKEQIVWRESQARYETHLKAYVTESYVYTEISRPAKVLSIQRGQYSSAVTLSPIKGLHFCDSERLMRATISSCGAKAAALRAVILGAPASGKGTVSSRIVQQFGISHISTGDKLRFHVANNTALGKQVQSYLQNGSLVPDDIMISLINTEIEALGNKNWLLDGFPRTLTQAERLQKIQPVNLVLNLVVPTSVILDRVKGRWTHMPSGRVYNTGFNDPKVPGRDDVTGEELVQREDDKPEVVRKRLQDYATKTEPVINYYRESGVLKDFTGSTTNEMWPHIKDHVAKFL